MKIFIVRGYEICSQGSWVTHCALCLFLIFYFLYPNQVPVSTRSRSECTGSPKSLRSAFPTEVWAMLGNCLEPHCCAPYRPWCGIQTRSEGVAKGTMPPSRRLIFLKMTFFRQLFSGSIYFVHGFQVHPPPACKHKCDVIIDHYRVQEFYIWRQLVGLHHTSRG